MNRDLAFLSRAFENELPKNKAYLYKYFKTPVQEAFLKYFYVFNDYTHFMTHTGYRCSQRWLANLHAKLTKLETLHDKAKKEMDLELLAYIESGNHKDFCESNRRDDEEEDDGLQVILYEV